MRGIRVRITSIAAVVVAVVLVVMAFALVASQRRILVGDLEETLATHSDVLATAYEDGDLESPIVAQGDDDAIAQVVTDTGVVVAATANFLGQPALVPPANGAARSVRTTRLIDGEPEYRVLSRRAGDAVVHTATPLDDIEDSQSALWVGLAIAIPCATVALAAVIWWLVGRTLQPVEAMRREVADISGSNLHRRVAEPRTRDEIARLARTMNAMLDRVELSVDRQRRFVADASHELRSPLTRVRSELEVDLRHPQTADLLATHRSVLEETEHLQRIVEDLLLLARSDGNGSDVPRRPDQLVDVDDIVLREAGRARMRGGIGVDGIQMDTAGVSAAQVRGDGDELTRVVRNLTDNALRHARSRIVMTLAERSDHAVLTIADDGPGIAPEDRERVFERFTRLDESRSGGEGGTGLGLAIARAIVERHGGTIRVDPDYADGARFVVELPLPDAPSP